MESIKKEILLWIRLVSLLLLWAVLVYFSNNKMLVDFENLKKVPDAVALYVVMELIFTKWLWRLDFFQGWLVKTPYIHGTWIGELSSTWIDPSTNKKVAPTKIMLVVKQKFNKISCVMQTEESESYSTAAQIYEDDESGIMRLSYNYINRPKVAVRDRSEIHDGAAILKIVMKPSKELIGEYWTSRKSTGDISLKFYKKDLLQKIPE